MEIKKSNKANLENKRWVGFILGLIIALSFFFVAMEYSDTDSIDNDEKVDLLKNLVVQNLDMLPAIDQQDMAQKKDDRNPTIDDLLNLKRKENPPRVTPKTAGNMDSNDKKTAAPQMNDVPVVTTQATELPEESKVKEEDKEIKNKMTDDKADETIERYDDKVSKRILSDTPTPPGGWVEFMKWLTKNLKYPEAAKTAGKEGKVSVTFIVNIDGSVSDIKIKQSANPFMEQEALRVLTTMGRWKPGISKNKPCRSLVEIPIVFKL